MTKAGDRARTGNIQLGRLTDAHSEAQPPPGGAASWTNLVAIAIEDVEELHESFRGLSAEQISAIDQVRRGVAVLVGFGVIGAMGWMLRRGPKRCAEAVKWMRERKLVQDVHNPAGMIVSVLEREEPCGRRRRLG